MKKVFEKVEKALNILGLNPENARCSNDGEWLVEKGEFEIYIDAWKETELQWWHYSAEHDLDKIIQIAVPVCYVPANAGKEFYNDMLAMQHNIFNASFTINAETKIMICRAKIAAKYTSEENLAQLIGSCGYYGNVAFNWLSDTHNVMKIKKTQ